MCKNINHYSLTSNNFYCSCMMDSASLIKPKNHNCNKRLPKYSDVNKVNSLFDFSDTETKNHIQLIYLNYYIFYEQYLEIQSTKLFIFGENASKTFFITSVNIRSLFNSLNFNELKTVVHNLNPKPDIIVVTKS